MADKPYVRPRRTRKHNGWLWKSGQRNCAYCGKTLRRDQMTTDHVKPLSAHGYDKRKNVVACCYACNQEKGRMSAEAYKKIWAERKLRNA